MGVGSSQEGRQHTPSGSLLYSHQDIENVPMKHADSVADVLRWHLWKRVPVFRV